MSVKIRLKRIGAKKNPFYRIIVADSRAPRDGRFIEEIGYYNPLTEPKTIKIDSERAMNWLNNGAKPTDTVERLFKQNGLYDESEVEVEEEVEVETEEEIEVEEETEAKVEIEVEAEEETEVEIEEEIEVESEEESEVEVETEAETKEEIEVETEEETEVKEETEA